MAAPNIVNVSTITAKMAAANLGTTLTTTLLSNSSGSGKVFKINTIIVSNVDGSNSADVTIDYHNGSTGYKIANAIPVAPKTTLVLTDKNSVIYLMEDNAIRGGASAASDLDVVISYEDLS